LHRACDGERDFRRDRKAYPQTAHPYDGGCMKLLQASFRYPVVGITVVIFAAAMCVSSSIDPAEKPSTTATASSASTKDDGALFTAFVSVSSHTRGTSCISSGYCLRADV